MAKPKLVVSIVTFNGATVLSPCLNSVLSQTYDNLELVIVDNNSTDNSVEVIKGLAPQAKIIVNKNNVGFGAGHNQVIEISLDADYILTLNQDAVLANDYGELLVDHLESNSKVGSAGGLILRPKYIQRDLQEIDTCGLRCRAWHQVTDINDSKQLGQINIPHKVFGVSGAVAMYRISALKDVSVDVLNKKECFDEDFFMYKEDVDLAYRLQLRGWEASCVASARAEHIRTRPGQLPWHRKRQDINLWSYRNHLWLLYKCVPTAGWWRWGMAITGFEFCKLAFILLFEWTTLPAWPQFWSKMAHMSLKRRYIQSRRTTSLKRLALSMKPI